MCIWECLNLPSRRECCCPSRRGIGVFLSGNVVACPVERGEACVSGNVCACGRVGVSSMVLVNRAG